jgi:hypothetical protein
MFTRDSQENTAVELAKERFFMRKTTSRFATRRLALCLGAAAIALAVAQPSRADDKPACDPYQDYKCLDSYLGSGIAERLANYYDLEWGQAGPPADPDAPSAARDGWPRTPATVPPMAYAEWPTGALTSIGVTRPSSADSPLMAAIDGTSLGKWLDDNHLQVYGWVNVGGNISSNERKYGNAPIAYTSNPNSIQMDQAVVYLERLPDTVQTDHFDWGFRFSTIYGENYRYTNSYGLASYQFNKRNDLYGYDFPMMYVDLFWPQVAQGLEVRVGRYISIPDIEAQLAPNNLMYTHSITYSWDNYTNTGVVGSLQVTKNTMLQLGITDGTETPLWHSGQRIRNLAQTFLDPVTNQIETNPLYPKSTYPRDPGNSPSVTACARFVWNDGWDTFYPCVDGLNMGGWGYNNIQWKGFTYYHKWNEHWSIDYESYWLTGYKIGNLESPVFQALYAAGGTPFSPQNIPVNSTNLVYCGGSTTKLDCTANAYSAVFYLNYTLDPLNNISFRPEWYFDKQGWRTGTGGMTQYAEFTVGWQHWWSPQIEFRPEVGYWRSFSTPAYNGDVYRGLAANRKITTEFAADVIMHF